MTLSFHVPGIPRPQGSKRLVRTKRGQTLMLEDNAKTQPWRDSVRWAGMQAARVAGVLDGPLHVTVVFRFPRPKKPKHRTWVVVKPDIDKLLRALFDGMTQCVWVDDNQVVSVSATKSYADQPGDIGAHVTVETFNEVPHAAAA